MVIFNHRAKWNCWSSEWFAESPFVRCFPIMQEILNVSQIAVTIHGIRPPCFHPDRAAEISRMFLLSHFVLPALQNHVSQNDEALTFTDTKMALHNLCQIPVKCQNIRLSDRLSDRETFVTSFAFTEKSLFCTDKPVTIEWLNLAQEPRTYDCCATHTPR